MSNSLYNTTINPKLLPALICLEADLFFSTRLVDVIRAQGGQPIVVETPEAFVQAMNLHAAVLALVDLATEGDWAQAITQCKNQQETKQTPIYAFGSHVDTETLRLARKAGADGAEKAHGLAQPPCTELKPLIRATISSSTNILKKPGSLSHARSASYIRAFCRSGWLFCRSNEGTGRVRSRCFGVDCLVCAACPPFARELRSAN